MKPPQNITELIWTVVLILLFLGAIILPHSLDTWLPNNTNNQNE